MGSSSTFTCSSIRHTSAHVCIKVDFRSAFNAIERARIVEAFAHDTELNDMHRYTESHLRPRSRIYYLSGGCLIRAEYDSVQRGQQEAFEASSGINKTTKRLFDAADSTLAPAGGCARATCDDLTLCGPAHIVWEVDVGRYTRLIQEKKKPIPAFEQTCRYLFLNRLAGIGKPSFSRAKGGLCSKKT